MDSFQKFFKLNESLRELQDYGLIPIENVKRAEDVKEMWLVYYLDSVRQKNQLKDFLKKHLDEAAEEQINKNWNFKLRVQDLDDDKLAVIASDLNLEEPALLKMDFIEILGAYSSRLRSVVQGSTKILSRDYLNSQREQYDTLSWISLFRPKLIGIKTKYKEMAEELPELEGIFENEQEATFVTFFRLSGLTPLEKKIVKLAMSGSWIKEKVVSIEEEGDDLKIILETNNKKSVSSFEVFIHDAALPYFVKQKPNATYGEMQKIFSYVDGVKKKILSKLEYKVKEKSIHELEKELPELEGVFENKKENKADSVLLSFTDLHPQDKKVLLKAIEAKNSSFVSRAVPASKWGVQVDDKTNKVVLIITLMNPEAYEGNPNGIRILKHSLQGMLATEYSKAEPDAIQFQVDRSFGRIFDNCELKLIQKDYYLMTKELPELEGIFEATQNETKLRMWFKIDPTIKRDFNVIKLKIAILSFRAGVEVFVNGCKDVIIKRRNNGFVVDVIFDEKVIASESDKNKISRIIQNHWSEVQRKHELDKKTSDYTAKWITPYTQLAKELPELKGIFESEQNEFVDINVKMSKTDKYGATTTHSVIDSIAYEIIRVTGNIMRNYYRAGNYSYEYKISESPLCFKILDVPKDIADDYLLEINKTIHNLDRWADGLSADDGYYINDLTVLGTEIDEKGNKMRKMTKELPELEGIFESEQDNENDAYLFRFTNLSQEDKDFLIKSFEYANWKYTGKDKRYNIHDKGPGNFDVIWPNKYTKRDLNTLLGYLRNQLILMTIENKELYGRRIKKPIREENLNKSYAIIRRGFKNCDIKPIQMKYYNLSKELPELEGIFENEESKESLIDIGVELVKYDKYSNPTTPNIVKVIAKDLIKNTRISMTNNWDCGDYKLNFEWQATNNPFGFVIKGVPKPIYETYMIELKEEAQQLQDYLNTFVKNDEPYYVFDYKTIVRYYKDEYGSLRRELPELEGIF